MTSYIVQHVPPQVAQKELGVFYLNEIVILSKHQRYPNVTDLFQGISGRIGLKNRFSSVVILVASPLVPARGIFQKIGRSWLFVSTHHTVFSEVSLRSVIKHGETTVINQLQEMVTVLDRAIHRIMRIVNVGTALSNARKFERCFDYDTRLR